MPPPPPRRQLRGRRSKTRSKFFFRKKLKKKQTKQNTNGRRKRGRNRRIFVRLLIVLARRFSFVLPSKYGGAPALHFRLPIRFCVVRWLFIIFFFFLRFECVRPSKHFLLGHVSFSMPHRFVVCLLLFVSCWEFPVLEHSFRPSFFFGTVVVSLDIFSFLLISPAAPSWPTRNLSCSFTSAPFFFPSSSSLFFFFIFFFFSSPLVGTHLLLIFLSFHWFSVRISVRQSPTAFAFQCLGPTIPGTLLERALWDNDFGCFFLGFFFAADFGSRYRGRHRKTKKKKTRYLHPNEKKLGNGSAGGYETGNAMAAVINGRRVAMATPPVPPTTPHPSPPPTKRN